MDVNTEVQGKRIRSFQYPWRNKYFDGPLFSVFVILSIGKIFAYPGEYQDVLTVWIMAGVISLIVFIAALREILIHQPLELCENGINAFTVKKGLVQWGFPKREFVSWSSIDRVEPFAYPNWGSRKENSGFQLWIKDRRIRIYEELQGFSEILLLIRSSLPNDTALDRLIDRPPFGELNGQIIGTYSYKWTGRYFVVIGVSMMIGLAVCFTIIGSSKVDFLNPKPHEILGLSIIWGLFGGLALIGFFMARERYVLLQPLILTEDGIQGPLNNRKNKFAWYWQKAASIFFRWSDIDVMERFSYDNGDIESKIVLGRDGISLVAGFHRMAIFQHISNYPEVESLLRKKLPHLASSLDKDKTK